MQPPVFEIKTVAMLAAGCFGVLLYRGIPFAVTCERTFDNGRPVIGAGKYRCKRDFYHRGGYPTYEIFVPGHSLVKFHRGNLETDSKACVLVAESFARFDGQPGVASSKDGFAEFMQLAEGLDEFELVVSGR